MKRKTQAHIWTISGAGWLLIGYASGIDTAYIVGGLCLGLAGVLYTLSAV